jgi:hypothetical protein
MQKTKNRSCSLPSPVFRHLSSDLKRPVLLQTHPGSLRSGSDHDWYARTRMTEDGKQKTEKVLPLFVAVSRRHHPANRMRFLFTMSILSESSDQADCPTHPLYRRSRFTPSHTTLAQNHDLQTDIFHRNAKPLSRSLPTSVF